MAKKKARKKGKKPAGKPKAKRMTRKEFQRILRHIKRTGRVRKQVRVRTPRKKTVDVTIGRSGLGPVETLVEIRGHKIYWNITNNSGQDCTFFAPVFDAPDPTTDPEFLPWSIVAGDTDPHCRTIKKGAAIGLHHYSIFWMLADGTSGILDPDLEIAEA